MYLHTITQYNCTLCNYITAYKSNYTRHLKSKKCIENNKKSQISYKCPRCDKSFRDNYNLNRHLNKKNSCMNNTNILKKYIIKINPKILNKQDRLLLKEVMCGENINEGFNLRRLMDAAIKKYRHIYKSIKRDNIPNFDYMYQIDEDTKYVNDVLKNAFFKEEQYLFIPPIYDSSRLRKLGIKVDNELIEFNEIVFNKTILKILNIEESIQDSPLKPNMFVVYNEVKNVFNNKKNEYLKSLYKYLK